MTESIIILTKDAVIIDGRLFTPTAYPPRCPKCHGEVTYSSQEGFYSRAGCTKCNVWFDKVYCKP